MARKKSKKSGKKSGKGRRSSGKRAGTAVVARKSGKKTKRKLSKEMKRPVQPDKRLASIIGSKKLQRCDILKKIWGYFKKNRLNKGRTIRLDDRLKDSGIWGRKSKIDMLEVGKAMKHAK